MAPREFDLFSLNHQPAVRNLILPTSLQQHSVDTVNEEFCTLPALEMASSKLIASFPLVVIMMDSLEDAPMLYNQIRVESML